MKVIKLLNPLDSAIRSKFMTGNGADISTFPKMTERHLDDIVISMSVLTCNYINIDDIIYKIVCRCLKSDSTTIYVTTEPGQIIEILKDNELNFINFTQIQTIGLRAGFKI